jgi:hypothetical protein
VQYNYTDGISPLETPMYDPDRLRKLIERLGKPAHGLVDRQLTYWHKRSDPFPHASRVCKNLGSRPPEAVTVTLADMGEEGWACHDCSIDPPDDGLGAVIEAFEEMEGLSDEFVAFRSIEEQLEPLDALHHAYRFAVTGLQYARRYRSTMFQAYSQGLAAGYLHHLATVRTGSSRSPRKPASGDRRVAVDVDWIMDEPDVAALDELDRLVLKQGQPIPAEPFQAILTVAPALLGRTHRCRVRDLGAVDSRTDPKRRNSAKGSKTDRTQDSRSA